MTLDKIITLANASSRLMFIAMERSLRSTGCDLPLYVIPYNEQKFDLPKNSIWLDEPDFYRWVDTTCAHPTMRKYLTLTLGNYQYIDTDAIFLQNPQTVLTPYEGLVFCCTEWNKPEWTVTESSRTLLAHRWSTWQKEVFSSGQYACDAPLYTFEELRQFAEQPENRPTCIEFPVHEQPGINLFALSTTAQRVNLTLPPFNMESSWAGDYKNFPTWDNPATKPYLIHYAGALLYEENPLNKLFLEFFTKAERQEWDKQYNLQQQKKNTAGRWPLGVRIINTLSQVVYPKYHVQQR